MYTVRNICPKQISQEKQRQHLMAVIRLTKHNMLYGLYKTRGTRVNIKKKYITRDVKEGKEAAIKHVC